MSPAAPGRKPAIRWRAVPTAPPRRALALVMLLLAATLAGCRGLDLHPAHARRPAFDPLATARSLLREGKRLERDRSDTSVDRYYAAAVHASAGLADADPRRADAARLLHNEALGETLRAARCFGRIDPRRRLIFNGPAGAIEVPIAHRGFVWKPADFEELLDPRFAPNTSPTRRRHCRRGLGRVTINLIRRPDENVRISCQIRRDNPGALTEFADRLPTSIDSLFSGGPVLATLARLPRAPRVEYHSIVGTAHAGLHGPKGDFIVPVQSASIPDVASEAKVPADHLAIPKDPRTVAEVARILGV